MTGVSSSLNNDRIVRNLKILLKNYNTITTALQSDEVRQDLTKLTNLTQALTRVQSEIEAILELLDTENRLLLEKTIRENRELFSELLNNFKTTRKNLKQKMKLIEKILGDGILDITGYIKYYLKITQECVEILSEEDFDITDETMSSFETTTPYKYYGSSNLGIVYLEPLIHNYNELPPIDFDVLVDEVFKKHPAVTMVNLKLDGSIKALSLSEIMSRMQVYLNKPIKLKATLISLSASSKNVLFRFKAIKGSGQNVEETIIYNIPPQEKAILGTSTAKIDHKDPDNISWSIIEFELSDGDTYIKAFTLSDYLPVLKDNLGAELEFWGIIYPKLKNQTTAEQEYIMWVTDIKTAEEEVYKLTDERKKEIEEFIKKFKDGRELLEWMIDSYAPRIRYKEPGDFVWRMKLTHLILAQNSWLGNKGMIHALLLSRPGKGKSTLASHYLPMIAKRVKYAITSRISTPGLLGGLDPATKETRVGVLKSADKGIMVIDEIDKLPETEKTIIKNLNGVLQDGKVEINLGNQSRSIEYRTRPNLLLLGNYSTEELEEELKYYTDDESRIKVMEEFISKEMLKVTAHLSTLDRFIILDSDIFQTREVTIEEAEEDFSAVLKSIIEAETSDKPVEEATPLEIVKMKLIRDILIYHTNMIDTVQLIKSIDKYKKDIVKFVLEEKQKTEQKRTYNNISNLIKVIAILKGEQEVTRDTVDLALMLAGISRKYKEIWGTREKKLKQFVEEFFEEEIIRELPIGGIEEDSIRKKFRETIVGFTEQEKKELWKILDSKIKDLTNSKILKKEGKKLKLGNKRLSEAFRRFIGNYERFIVRKRSTDEYYYDPKELSRELGISTSIVKEFLYIISQTGKVERSTILEDGKQRTVYLVKVDLYKVADLSNKLQDNSIPLELSI